MNIIDNRDNFLISEINAILPQTTFSKMVIQRMYPKFPQLVIGEIGRVLAGESGKEE